MSRFDLLIYAKNVFTANAKQPHLDDAAIVVDNGKIVWLGSKELLPDIYTSQSQETIHAPSGCLTPGLIDCHTHLVYAGNRANEFKQRLEGLSYTDIAKQGGGIQATVAATRAASVTQLLEDSQHRLNHWLSNGVTHIEIKSGYGLNLETEAKILQVVRSLAETNSIGISPTLLAAHSLAPEYLNDSAYRDNDEAKAAYIAHICDDILPELHQAGLITAVDAFCENIAFSPEEIRPLFEKAKGLGIACKLHAEQLSNQGGSALAAEFNALSVDHLEYLDESAIKRLANSGTVAVLLPGAFYYLNETKLPPINLLRKYQVPMAIATDCNPGTSPCTSLPLMINMACVEFGLTPSEAITGVTLNAAKALGIDEQTGSLEVGKSADMVLWNIQEVADLAYQFGQHDISWTLFQGDFRDPSPKARA